MSDLLDSITTQYSLEAVDPNTYSPLSLAFIGDGVYGLIVKTVITMQGNCSANQLDTKSVRYVKAVSQAKMIDMMLENDYLTEEESNIYRRGRNGKSASKAKNASTMEYRKATGLEALVGYLYLKGETDRAVEIVKWGMEMLDAKTNK